MNMQRLFGGIICLAVAALIMALLYALPEGSMVFTVGDANLPYVPAIILGIIGFWLVGTAWEDETGGMRAMEKNVPITDADRSANEALNKRLEGVAWGLFLVMLGGLGLVPETVVPKGIWSVGVGAIMLGLNGARYYYGLKMSGFTTFLGILAVLSGVTGMMGWNSLDGAFFLIILGAYLILKPWFDKKQLFGKVA